MDLANANMVITGGSQGIGEQIGVAAAKRGANVLLVARSEDKLQAVAQRIGGEYLVADLTNEHDVDTLTDRALEQMGHIDVWINNAGLETIEKFATSDYSHLRTLARLNFEAPLLLTRRILPHMVERGRGHIVQTSSVAATIVFPGLAAYCGTKAGLTNFSETLRLELAGSGVGVTILAPGPVDTDMWDRLEQTDDDYVLRSLKRFRQLGFLPKLSVESYGETVAKAIENNTPYLGSPRRYMIYHILSRSPRKMVQMALTGVKPR